MKAKKDYLVIAELLNMMRVENKGKVFSVKELKTQLHGILPTYDWSRTFLVKAKIFNRIGFGKYAFPNEPIHWTCIQKFYEQIRERKQAARENRAIKAIEPATVETNVTTQEYDEGKAVAFLKNRGYVILKMM